MLAVEDTASRPGVGCLRCSTAPARGCRGRSSIRWPTSTGCSPPVPASVWGSELTAKLLSVIGIPAPGAELTTSLWSSTRSIDFEVPDVSEEKLDLGALGKALIGRTIGTSPATQDLLRQPRRAHAADNPNSGQPAHRDPFHLRSRPVFRGFSGRDRNLIGKANASVSWKQESSDIISFTGTTPVTLAFAAVPCAIQPDHSFKFGVEQDELTFGTNVAAPAEQPVIAKDSLLDFDELA